MATYELEQLRGGELGHGDAWNEFGVEVEGAVIFEGVLKTREGDIGVDLEVDQDQDHPRPWRNGSRPQCVQCGSRVTNMKYISVFSPVFLKYPLRIASGSAVISLLPSSLASHGR